MGHFAPQVAPQNFWDNSSFQVAIPGITIIGQYKAMIRDFLDFSNFLVEIFGVDFNVFWSKSRVLGRIGRSGKVLGFISSNFGPNPTAGRLLKGNHRGAIIIIIIPDDCERGQEHAFCRRLIGEHKGNARKS